MRAVSLTGDSVTLGETTSGRAQLLVFFAANCPYCRENVPAWRRITARLRADSARRFDIVWVSLSSADSARAWMAEHGLRDTVVRMPDRKALSTYRVRGVPITLLMDERGQVLHMHPSVFRTTASEDSLVRVALAVRPRPTRTAPVAGDSQPALASARRVPAGRCPPHAGRSEPCDGLLTSRSSWQSRAS